MDEILQLIREHGGVLERSNTHNVYRFPDGRIYVLPKSPSDVRALKNNLSALRRFLGVKREIVKNQDRKEKKGVAAQKYEYTYLPREDFKTKLRKALEILQKRKGS